MRSTDNVFSLRTGKPVPPLRSFFPGQSVECPDPDATDVLGRPAITDGVVHSIDMERGDILVRLAGEPCAAIRLKPAQVTPAPVRRP